MKKLLIVAVLTAAFVAGLLFAMKVSFRSFDLGLGTQIETMPPVPPESFAESGYYYARLTDAEKAAYAAIVTNVEAFPDEIEIPAIEAEQLGRAARAAALDHPMLYMFEQGISLARHDGKSFFVPHYGCTKEEYDKAKAQVEQKVQGILAQMPEGSVYDNELFLHDAVTGHCAYDTSETAPDNYNPVGALVNGSAVCSGYAKAFKLLLDAAGIESTMLTGKTSDDGSEPTAHIWNAVKIGGRWYYVDVTWDDPVSDSESETDEMERFGSYNYFNVTNAMLAPTHSDYEFDYPCDDESLFYYRVNHAYLTEEAEDAVQFAADLIAAAAEDGRDYIDFKCETDGLYRAATKKLFTNEKIYRAIDLANLKLSKPFNNRSVRYSADDTNKRIIIVLNKGK